MAGTFRSLKVHNYRLWAGGAIVSNVGTWMQRTAQDWIVLTQLTHNNATAVGVVMALQFGPQVLLLPLTGFAADNFDRRKLLMITQSLMGLLALGLGLLTVAGVVTLWEVYLFAGLLGCVTAFDAPARQTFVSELVGEAELSNAVGLNSASFNAARLIGPAIAGVLIGAVGTGLVFLLNAASYVAVIASLTRLRLHELHRARHRTRAEGGLAAGFGYVWRRPDLRAIMVMLWVIGTFGINFAVFISTMSVSVFHVGAEKFGLLASIMAIGSVSGALMSAQRQKPRLTVLIFAAALFGTGFTIAAFMPDYWLFGLALVMVGAASQTFTTTAISTVQMTTDPKMRGRVMAILMAITLGGTPIGAPIVGWVADTFGPRWAVGVGAAAGFVAVIVGVGYLVKYRRLRLRFDAGRPRFSIEDAAASSPAPASPIQTPPAQAAG